MTVRRAYLQEMQPKVSVVLPVYNGEMYLAAAIESIRRQTFTDWELVILDDGSTDGSPEVCRHFAEEDGRITVLRNQANQGLARGMNRLVHHARGDFIAVQEQDDVSVPERLSLEVEILNSRPRVGLVSGVAEWVDDEGHVFAHFPGLLHRGESYPTEPDDMVRFLYIEQCKVVNACCMFRKSLLQEHGIRFDADARMSIDWRFFIDLAHYCEVHGIPRVLVSMRRGMDHGSLTKQKDLQFWEARRMIREVYRRYRPSSDSPINTMLYLRAFSSEYTLEGRYHGGWKGLGLVSRAILCDPLNRAAWASLSDFFGRGVRRYVWHR
jgi:glycosyltransferase involved in cell wall biosynthesis